MSRKAGLAAAAIAIGTAVAYVILIASKGERGDLGVAILVTAIIGGAAAAAIIGAEASGIAKKRLMYGAASGGLLSLGLAIFSIGLLLQVAGTLSAVAWIGSMVGGQPGGRWVAVGAFVAAAALPLALAFF